MSKVGPSRVLFISPEFPYPPASGGRARSYYLLQAIAEWAPTDLMTYSEAGSMVQSRPLSALCHEVNVIALPVHVRHGVAFVRRNFARAIRGVNPLVDRFDQPLLRSQLRGWMASRSYQAVIVEHTWMAPYIKLLRSTQPQALIVLDAHNVESDLWRQYYRLPKHWWHRPAAYRYFRAMLRIESRFISEFDLILATSPIDQQRLESFVSAERLFVIPNGTAVGRPEQRPIHAEPAVVGFLGSLDYPPNEASAIYLLEEVWPRISKKFPEAQLLIGGESSSPAVRRIAQSAPRVRLVGYVPEVESFLDRLDVMVIPLRHGSGTRIKILDAWARGLPVVSTRKGAEGIEHTDGEDILIADGPEEVAAAVVKLLSNPALRRQIGDRAAERVQLRYAWKAIGKRLTDLLGARLRQVS